MSEISMPDPNKPVASRAERGISFALADWPMPKGREEDWRFTPMKRVKSLLEDTLSGSAPEVLVDGKPLDQVKSWGQGGEITTLETLDPVAGGPGDRAAVVSWNNAAETIVFTAAAGEKIATPLVVEVNGTCAEPTAQRIVINAGAQSSATIILKHSGRLALNQTVEIYTGEQAELTVVALQENDETSVHLSNHRIVVGAGATVQHGVVSLGGDLVRVCSDVSFAAERGDVNMLGLYFTGAGQHHEHRLFVAHERANCKSRVTYKGALQGKEAHSVWVGDVLIGPEAYGTDTYELNRNLVLGKGPKADSVPNLEIENGQIEGAGHASATGRFDDEQLFYLCSRGIDEVEARRLVVRAFFAELIGEIGVEEITEPLMESVEKKLQQGGALA